MTERDDDDDWDDASPVVSFTVPLFIRLLEFAREDAKSDIDLHNIAEKATQSDECWDMDDYAHLIERPKMERKERPEPRRSAERPKVNRIAKDYVS